MYKMDNGLCSLIPKERLDDVLDNFHSFTGLAIQLINSEGVIVSSFGKSTGYCSILKKLVFDKLECYEQHMKAGKLAQSLGESYVFSCHAGLNHIAFPLICRGQLLGSVIIGPFLMDKPDSSLVTELSEKYSFSTAVALELFEEAENIIVYSPAQVHQLEKLINHLLLPLLPGEQQPLSDLRSRMAQQGRINETIQSYKEEKAEASWDYLYGKEKELISMVRAGNTKEVKAMLNELIGYVLFSEGLQLDAIKVRSIELTTLLSRVAIEGGANPELTFKMNSNFISGLYKQENMDEICMQMQNVLEGFMRNMYNEKDKGNPYIRKALRYMFENYHEHLELAQVADFVKLSPSYFSALFRETVGISFSEQLCRIRIEASKRLLLSGNYSLADISVAVGFPDQSYYCKVFKRVVGITPGKFKS